MMPLTGRRVLVTGATGFLGSGLTARIAAEGAEVFGLSRHVPSRTLGVKWIACDLEDRDRLIDVIRGFDSVFHAGGMVGHYGARDAYLRANVGGTRNVIDACTRGGVDTLIFTSTPSVIADGTGHYDVDERHPYSRRFQSPYSESKALAEQEVLAANGGNLRTVCVRPHMIWGPGPSHWVGGVRKLARKNRLFQVGDGKNRVGMTYMDDCVSAHLAALRAAEADAAVGGQAFFVHGGSPVLLWQWVRELAHALGLAAVRGTIPKRVAMAGAGACDALVRLSDGAMHFPLSRYLVSEMTTDHYSCIDRARAWLGYEPKVTVAEGIARMAEAERSAPAGIQRLGEPSLIG